MGAIADAINNEPDVRFEEQLSGDNVDISGYDPMDFGDEEGFDFAPDDVAEDTTNFATEYRNGPAVKEQKQQDQQQEQQRQPVNQPKAGNVHAKLRIVERENKILADRFNKLVNALTNPPDLSEAEDEEEEIVPFEQDPLNHMASQLNRVTRSLEEQKADVRKNEEKRQVAGLLSKADDYTMEIVDKVGPQIWDEAMEHLANVRIEDFCERNPDRTRDEASQIIGNAILREKVQLVAQGRNPAEIYLKDAIRFGFRPSAARKEAAVVAPESVKQTTRTAKEEIRSQNSKGQGTRTTASLNGAPAKQKLSAKTVVGMDERDFRDLVDEVSKDRRGDLRLRDFILPNA